MKSSSQPIPTVTPKQTKKDPTATLYSHYVKTSYFHYNVIFIKIHQNFWHIYSREISDIIFLLYNTFSPLELSPTFGGSCCIVKLVTQRSKSLDLIKRPMDYIGE